MNGAMSTAVDIVQEWHRALNAGEVDAMVALVDENVVVGGPHGTTSGAAVVREWFGRANVRLIPLTYFARGQVVVVEEEGQWMDAGTGAVTSSQGVATHFVVGDGVITSIRRHDMLDSALAEAKLTAADLFS